MATQFYTYLIIDPSRNDEIIYVGKGTDKRRRAESHFRRKDKHPLTQRIQKMLREDIHPIIKKIECSTEEAALELEVGLIRIIGRKDLKTGSLLNLTDGGEGIRNLSDYSRAKISISMRGNRNGVCGRGIKRPSTSSKMKGNKNGIGNSGPGLYGEENPGIVYRGRTWSYDPVTNKRIWH